MKKDCLKIPFKQTRFSSPGFVFFNLILLERLQFLVDCHLGQIYLAIRITTY